MKKIIGIIANTIGFDSNNPFDDKYFVQNQYIDAIKSNGGIPYKIFGNKVKTNSIHKQALKYITYPFKVTGKSSDNIIEIIEYKNIIGVQFHPELMKNSKKIFKWLIS